jgi:hypothetical protein
LENQALSDIAQEVLWPVLETRENLIKIFVSKCLFPKCWIRRPRLGAPIPLTTHQRTDQDTTENCFHTGSEARDECMIGAVFEANKKIPVKLKLSRTNSWGSSVVMLTYQRA